MTRYSLLFSYIDSGTIDSTEFNLAFHVQQISSKVGVEKSQAGNNFYLDNFHFDLDKDQHEAAVTVGESYESFGRKRALVKYQFQSEVI